MELDISPEIIMTLYLPCVACLYVVNGSSFELLKYNKLKCLILADPSRKGTCLFSFLRETFLFAFCYQIPEVDR